MAQLVTLTWLQLTAKGLKAINSRLILFSYYTRFYLLSSGLCVPFSFLCPSTTSVDLETVWMHAKREPMQFQGVSEETEVFMEVAWKFDFLFARTWSFWSSASELALLVQLVFKIFTILAQSNSFFAVPNLLVLWHALQQVPVGIRTVLAFYVITSSLHVCMKLPFFFADITFDSYFFSMKCTSLHLPATFVIMFIRQKSSLC